jgi:radical SAM protein with 4Fe4S-binding SPASM domain
MTYHYAKHRFVFDKNSRVVHIAGASKRHHSGALNAAAAAPLRAISVDSAAHDASELYGSNKPFFDELYKNGWIDEDLKLQGSYREVPSPYHLKQVQIETLLKCNLSCGYCYCSAGNDRKEAISGEKLLEVLEDAERLGVMTVDFTGGEFFLRPDWKELLEHARGLGLTVSLHTNGMALTERNVTTLADLGIVRVQVSADAANAKVHNEVRGHPQAFEKTLAGALRLRDTGIETVINLMIHRHNVHAFKETYHFFHDQGFGVNADWIAPYGSELSAKYGVDISEYIDGALAIPEMRSLIDKHKPCGRDLGFADNQYEPDCGIGYSYVFITATGELAICPTLTSREDSVAFNGPNINDISLYDAWIDSPYFDKHRFVNCKNVSTCGAGTACRGGCRATAYAASKGKVDAPDPVSCNLFKNASNSYVDFYKRYENGEFGVAALN